MLWIINRAVGLLSNMKGVLEILSTKYIIKEIPASNSGTLHQNNKLKTKVTILTERLEAQKARVSVLTERLEAQKTIFTERMGLHKAKAIEQYGKFKHLKDVQNAAKVFYPLYRQGQFASAVSQVGEPLKADCYISLLPSTLPAAFDLKRQFGGAVFCDNVENVDVEKHSLAPRWSPVALNMVNSAAHGGMMNADGLLTVGHALADTLQRFGRPTFILKNFREFEEPEGNGYLRDACGLTVHDILLFASGNVVVGFEPVLEALHRLPPRFHLAALIALKPVAYETEMHQRIEELGLKGRVHFFPFVEYNKLASVAADADIGLITSDISNPNGAVALPNRCFDYLTAGLPVVSPAMPDVKTLIDNYGFGKILACTTAEEWHENISAVADNLESYRNYARCARRILTWDSQIEDFYAFLGKPRSLTFIGFRDLTRYQRYIRASRSLKKLGCSVNMVFFSNNPDLNNLVEGVKYYCTNDLYGVRAGFVRLDGLHDATE